MLILNYTLTKEDYLNFYLHIYWSGKKRKKVIKNHLTNALLLGVLMVLIRLLVIESLMDPYFLFSILIVLSIFIIPIFQMKQVYRERVDLLAENALNNGMFNEEYQVGFTETEIFAKEPYAETKYQWASIVKKEENNNYYFLYLNSDKAILIPKRALKSEEGKLQLDKLFNEHISSRRNV